MWDRCRPIAHRYNTTREIRHRNIRTKDSSLNGLPSASWTFVLVSRICTPMLTVLGFTPSFGPSLSAQHHRHRQTEIRLLFACNVDICLASQLAIGYQSAPTLIIGQRQADAPPARPAAARAGGYQQADAAGEREGGTSVTCASAIYRWIAHQSLLPSGVISSSSPLDIPIIRERSRFAQPRRDWPNRPAGRAWAGCRPATGSIRIVLMGPPVLSRAAKTSRYCCAPVSMSVPGGRVSSRRG